MSSDGESRGHYTCDVNPQGMNDWFRTNDNCLPEIISINNVSKHAYVILYERS